ncbi:MAG: hypothetical protein IT432_12200 [Phycisphaerales bacterium]|nr:hypothetical protein [Phycisphaerales bacterium]
MSTRLQTMHFLCLATLLLSENHDGGTEAGPNASPAHGITMIEVKSVSATESSNGSSRRRPRGLTWAQVHDSVDGYINQLARQHPSKHLHRNVRFAKASFKNCMGELAAVDCKLIQATDGSGTPIPDGNPRKNLAYYVLTSDGESVVRKWAQSIDKTLTRQDVISSIAQQLLSSS